jgi:hypothetical protein
MPPPCQLNVTDSLSLPCKLSGFMDVSSTVHTPAQVAFNCAEGCCVLPLEEQVPHRILYFLSRTVSFDESRWTRDTVVTGECVTVDTYYM